MKGCIAIGDIHGCLAELEELIDALERDSLLSSETRLVFLGDYIDRGPASSGVIEYLIHLREKWDCVFLLGNHDDKFLFLLDQAEHIEPVNGEFETVLSYSTGAIERGSILNFLRYADEGASVEQAVRLTGFDKGREARFEMPESHFGFLSTLELYWEEDRVIYCHGGLRGGVGEAGEMLSAVHKYDLITTRGNPEDFTRIEGKVQVVGHNSRRKAEIEEWVCMIDTGCVKGRHLTALAIPHDWSSVSDFVVRQVPARHCWWLEAWNRIRHLVPARRRPLPLDSLSKPLPALARSA